MAKGKMKNFASLKLEWYQRLKDDGFRDLESARGHLKADVDKRTLNRAMQDKEPRETYFDLALTYLGFLLEGTRDWNIWFLHCEGKSNRTIGRILGMPNQTVDFRIKKIKKRANLG